MTTLIQLSLFSLALAAAIAEASVLHPVAQPDVTSFQSKVETCSRGKAYSSKVPAIEAPVFAPQKVASCKAR